LFVSLSHQFGEERGRSFSLSIIGHREKKRKQKTECRRIKTNKKKEELLTWILLGLRYELFFLYLPKAVKVKAMAYKRKSKDPASLPQTLECESGLGVRMGVRTPTCLTETGAVYFSIYIYLLACSGASNNTLSAVGRWMGTWASWESIKGWKVGQDWSNTLCPGS
jgi:hypothetical protein